MDTFLLSQPKYLETKFLDKNMWFVEFIYYACSVDCLCLYVQYNYRQMHVKCIKVIHVGCLDSEKKEMPTV